MKNWKAYLAGFIMAGFALLPFINIAVYSPGEIFPWLFFLSGFLAIYVQFLNINIGVKLIVLTALLNCFFSAGPLISFVAFMQFMACVCFYVLCLRVDDYKPIFKILKAVIIFNAFMFCIQIFGKDSLLNFTSNTYYGITGQHMQAASFTLTLAASVTPAWIHAWLFPMVTAFPCNSAGAFISAVAGMGFYLFKMTDFWSAFKITAVLIFIFFVWIAASGKLKENTVGGRSQAWKDTAKLYIQKPNMGWGIGTYKALFPALRGKNTGIPWKTAHNAYLQILFEMGIVGFVAIMGYLSWLILRLRRLLYRSVLRDKALACLVGLTMLMVNMFFAFPDRMIQCVLLIIFFFAYCQRTVDDGAKQT